MDKKVFLKEILEYFIKDREIPDNLNEMRKMYKDIMFNLDNYDIPEDILLKDDKYLRLELINKRITDGEKFNTININLEDNYIHGDKIALFEGDICALYGDVLISAVPSDFKLTKNNSVYLNGGLRLRKKCLDLVGNSTFNPTEILITRAYNLLSDYIIHVVLPNNEIELGMCYLNVLECANNNIAKTIILEDIDNKINNSKEILIDSVMKYLDRENCHLEKVIIATSKDDEFDEYIDILDKYKKEAE